MEYDEIVGVEVNKREQFATHREHVSFKEQDDVMPFLATLLRVLRSERVTGEITIRLSSGGIRGVMVDQTARIPEGSEADQVVEKLYVKQQLKRLDTASSK